VLERYSRNALIEALVCSYKINIHIETVVPLEIEPLEIESNELDIFIPPNIQQYYEAMNRFYSQYTTEEGMIIDTTSNDLAKTALAQTTSFLISDYISVHTQAIEFSQSQVEKEYTSLITRTTTLITSLILLIPTVLSVGAGTAIHGLKNAALEGGIRAVTTAMLKTLIVYVASIPVQVLTEEFEELYIDPAIEAFMIKWAASTGSSRKTAEFLSMFVSSFREAFLGAGKSTVSSFFNMGSGSNIKTNVESNLVNIASLFDQSSEFYQQGSNIVQDLNLDYATQLSQEFDANLEATTAQVDKVSNAKKRSSLSYIKSIFSSDRVFSNLFSLPGYFVGGLGMGGTAQLLDLSTDIIFELEVGRLIDNKRHLDPILDQLNTQKNVLTEVSKMFRKLSAEQVSLETKPASESLNPLQRSFAFGPEYLNERIEVSDSKQKFRDTELKQNRLASIKALKIEKSASDIAFVAISEELLAESPGDPVFTDEDGVKHWILPFVRYNPLDGRPYVSWTEQNGNHYKVVKGNLDLDNFLQVLNLPKGKVPKYKEHYIIPNNKVEVLQDDGSIVYTTLRGDMSLSTVFKLIDYDFENTKLLHEQFIGDKDSIIITDGPNGRGFLSEDSIGNSDRYDWAERYEGYKYIKTNFEYILKGSGIFDYSFDSIENARVLHYLYKYIISPISQGMLKTFGIQNSKGKLNKPHLVKLLKNNFKKYWITQLDETAKVEIKNHNLENEWNDFVDILFSDIFDERLLTSSEGRIEHTIENRLALMIFSKILYDKSINIGSKEFDLKSLPSKLSEFINNPSKVIDLFKFFQQEEGKSLFLNSFTETFLKSPKEKILVTPNTANSYFGWTSEMLYIYNDLPSRLAHWFVDNPEVSHYSGIEYSKENPEFIEINKDLLGLDISTIDFPKSSRWFDLGVYNFLSAVVSHHMKAVMVSPKNKKGILDNQKIKNLGADSISSLIVDFWKQASNSIKNKQASIILPTRTVEILTSIFEVDKELNSINAKTEAKGMAEKILKTILTTSYRELFTISTWKVPEEQFFLFDVAALINSEINGQTIKINDLTNTLTTIFAKDTFKQNLMKLVDDIYLKESKRQYIKKQGLNFINSVRDLFINNINQLTTQDSSGNIKLILNGYYNFYFSTGNILTGEDLLGAKNTFLFDSSISGFKGEITSTTEFNSAMMVGYDDEDNIWIIPVEKINSLPKNIHEGIIDEEGNEHHNLYLSNSKGYRLVGPEFFEKGEIVTRDIDSLINIYESTRKSKQQLDEDGNYINIPIFSSDFFVAYGFASGNGYISAIQKTTINIEHIEAFKPAFLDQKISYQGVNFKREAPINPKTSLSVDSRVNLGYLNNFLHQIYGEFDAKHIERNILYVFDQLLQLNGKGRKLSDGQEIVYTKDYLKQLIAVLSPTEEQIKKITQYFVMLDSSDKESIKPTELERKEFYKTFQILLKNAKNNNLIKGTLSSRVLNNVFSSGSEINSKDDKIMYDLNLALQMLFGDVGITLLKTGYMSFKVKGEMVIDLDFRKHNKKVMGGFLNRLNIKPIYSIKAESGSQYLIGTRSISDYSKSLEVVASFLISGYRESYKVDGSTKYRFYTPQRSFGNELFDVYLDSHYKRSYHEEVMTKFLDFHLAKDVILKTLLISRGKSEKILNGRQIVFKELINMIKTTLDTSQMPEIGTGTDETKRKVALYHLEAQFLHEFYLIPESRITTPWQSTRYFGEIRKSILTGTSSQIIYGNAKIVNPLFHIDKTNPATGFHIPIDHSRFSELELQNILWTLDFHELYGEIKPEFLNDHMRLENIWEQIKNPIKNTYDRLYDILWNSPNSKFTLRFYQAHSTGVDQNQYLGKVIPSKSRGKGIIEGTKIEITLDRDDPQSRIQFNEKILSAIHYLVKYPYSFTVVKTGNAENLLYTSLTEILSEAFIKTSFSSRPNIVGGLLSSYANTNYEVWKNDWNKDSGSRKALWTILNIYPIYLFSDANSDNFGREDFAETLINFFEVLTGEKYEGIDEILKLK